MPNEVGTINFSGIIIFIVSLFLLMTILTINAENALAASPAVVWEKTINVDINPFSIRFSNDSIFIVGNVLQSDINNDIMDDIQVIKTDSSGRFLWNKTLGGPLDDVGWDVCPMGDGGCIVIGRTEINVNGSTDSYLVRLDRNGGIVWSKTIGTGFWERPTTIQPCSDGGYVLAGLKSVNGHNQAYAYKLDSNFSIIWQKEYVNDPEYNDSDINNIQETTDGGFIMAGVAKLPDNDLDTYVIKTDSSGNLSWSRVFQLNNQSNGWYVRQTSDGGYIILGELGNRYIPNQNIWGSEILKIDPSGNFLWNISLPGMYQAYYLSEIGDNYNIVGTYSTVEDNSVIPTVTFINVSRDGKIEDLKNVSLDTKNVIIIKAVQTGGGDYIVNGITINGIGQGQLFLSRIDPNPDLVKKAVLAVIVTGISIGLVAISRLILDALNNLAGVVSEGIKIYTEKYFSVLESRRRKVTAAARVPFILGFSSIEITVAVISIALIGAGFAYAGNIFSFNGILYFSLVSGMTLVVYEVVQRYFAFKYHVESEYKFWGLGALTLIFTSLVGQPFALPARTIINNEEGQKARILGIISIAGPVACLLLFAVFLMFTLLGGGLSELGKKGMNISLLFSIYNLVPFYPMEGLKVIKWNRWAWAVLFAPLIVSYIVLLTIGFI